ncbi:MAG: EamA family transporter [Kiloniellaceae bacterium]
MALDLGVLLLVLLAAVLHATWNALVKAGGDRLAVTTLVMLVPGLPSIAALFFLPPLGAASWPFLILSTLVHYLYFTVLIGAYRHGDLSQVYPIARGAAPALVAVEAWIFAAEPLRTSEMAGVLIVSVGIMSLSWRRRGPVRDGEAKAIAFALLTALSIAVYLLADGMGVRRAGHPLTYICWLFALEGVPLLCFTLWRRRGQAAAVFRPHLKAGLFGGAIAGLSYGITIWAMSLGPMAHIVAIRETSVLFGAAIGALVLKEPFGRHRIAAAAVVAGGAVLLNLGL